MTTSQHRRPTSQSQSQSGRLSEVFWQLADQSLLERRDPESVAAAWLSAVDGLDGRRQDRQAASIALVFLMRLESDPFYASPEQTRGGEKDSRGLVYSLALFLFERLTGHHPFVESLSPLECRIQQAKAKRIGTNNLCHLPRSLRTILSCALSPFAEDRFRDVAAMRASIEGWLQNEAPAPSILEELRAAPRPFVQAPGAGSITSARVQRRRTAPPPPPAPRRAFVEVDTLQGAVAVTDIPSPTSPQVVSTASSASPPSWMWPSISGGFAVVAAVALFVAVQVGSKNAPAQQSASQANIVAQAPAPIPTITPTPAPEWEPEAPAMQIESKGAEETTAEIREPAADAKTSALQAVDVVRECLPATRLRSGVSLGISLLYNSDGTVKRSFTGRLPFTGAEVSCLKDGLAKIETRSDDELGRMMSYDLYVSVSSERTRSRQARH